MKWFPLLLLACNTTPKEKVTPTAAHGKDVYMANCIACHAADPSKDGAIGPAVKGSSRELLEARVMRGAYPEGYKPKRDTKNMVPLPHLKTDLEDLFLFLN